MPRAQGALAYSLDNPPYTETQKNELSRFVPHPRFQTSAVAGAIASGIFSQPDDIELFTLLLSSREALHDLNSRLDRSEDLMLVKPEITKEYRIKIRDSKALEQLRKRLVKLLSLLVEKYGVPKDEPLFQALKP